MTEKMDSSAFALKTIEFQMNKHLKNKNGQKYKKVSIDVNERHMYNEESFNSVVDDEIKNTMSTKKWASLPLYFKWNCVLDYLKKNDIVDKKVIAEYKDNLNKNKLDGVLYDPVLQEITNITII
jgi:hypothetical protein